MKYIYQNLLFIYFLTQATEVKIDESGNVVGKNLMENYVKLVFIYL